MITAIADSIWTIPSPLSLGGLKLNTRATIVRLQDGALWVHSPVRLTDDLKTAVERLGPVKWLIAPCLMHHLFIGAWKTAFPEAQVLAPPGLSKKRPDLEIADTIIEGATWRDEVDVLYVEGFPANQEHLFFHRASGTLIVTDLAFYNPDASGFTQLYLWFNRVSKRPNMPYLVRLFIKDKTALVQSLAPTREWPIEHISFCHHALLSVDAQAEWHRLLDGIRPR